MKKLHYRIYLHTQYENAFCKEMVIIAANTNADEHTLPINRLFDLSVLAIKTNNFEDVSAHLHEEENLMVIDVKDSSGNWHTALELHQIELLDIVPTLDRQNEN